MRISLRWPTRPRSGPCSIRKRRRGKDVDSPAQAPRMEDHSPLRVVAIGGGTRPSPVPAGVEEPRLRREFDGLPPGDIRNCMVALSEDSALLSRLFQYRFLSGRGLKGHSFGNL